MEPADWVVARRCGRLLRPGTREPTVTPPCRRALRPDPDRVTALSVPPLSAGAAEPAVDPAAALLPPNRPTRSPRSSAMDRCLCHAQPRRRGRAAADGDAVLIDEEWWSRCGRWPSCRGPPRPSASTMEPGPRAGRPRAHRRRMPDRLTARSASATSPRRRGRPRPLVPPALQRTLHQRHPPAPRLGRQRGPQRARGPLPTRRPVSHLGRRHAGRARWSSWLPATARSRWPTAGCDEPGTVETGAWRWVVFGFLPVEPLPGPGTPSCVDIDGDGRTEPAIIERSEP